MLVEGIDGGMGGRFETGMGVKTWMKKIRKSAIKQMDGEMGG